jgi:CubicO group peptidase (beta-lactamase class C family)
MGFGSVMAMPDTYPIQTYIREYRLGGDGPKLPTQLPATDEWMRKLGSLPLMAQPGERWMYHISIEALGVLVARASGQSLGAFMRERIFDPLGMKDTAFHVPADKIDRFPSFYTATLQVFDDPGRFGWDGGFGLSAYTLAYGAAE